MENGGGILMLIAATVLCILGWISVAVFGPDHIVTDLAINAVGSVAKIGE